LKIYFKAIPLVIFVFSPLLVFWLSVNITSSQKVVAKNPIQIKPILNLPVLNLPSRLLIPAIGVNAGVQYVGVNDKGEMEVPNNITDVGLFKFGAVPGQTGSAVIAGHFNGENNQEGVFANLDKLKAGDKLSIEGKTGKSITFIVQKKELYDSGYADDVFNQSDSAHLNLVTCDGLWDEVKKSYTKRLVIFSDILKE